jgi:hypothetical protein
MMTLPKTPLLSLTHFLLYRLLDDQTLVITVEHKNG